jgi:PAS domain S-box-containing protein
MSIPNFVQKFAVLQRNMEELHRSVIHSPERWAGAGLEAVEELQRTLHQLQAAEEELCQQNEELTLARQAVEAERQRYQELFDFAPDGYLVTTATGTIREANRAAAALLHVPHNLLMGKPLLVFVPQAEREAFRVHLHQALEGRGGGEWEVRIQPRGGAPFEAALTVAVVRDPTSRVVGLRWLVRDITARKRAEAEIRALNEELDQRVRERTAELRESEQRFRALVHEREQQLIASDRLISFAELAASLAHEFNNPLGIVLGFIQDLLTEVDPSDPHFHSLRIIEEETKRCIQMMRQLLEFACPVNTAWGSTDLAEVVRHSLNLVSGHLRKLQVYTALEIQPGLPQVQADVQQLQQVLLNLFFNAIEAMPYGGRLSVRVTATPGARHNTGQALAAPPEVYITVTDTGVGIAADDLARVFRPFFSAKKTRGMGLGLSICENIIKAHGGRIDVESSPGRGTTFRLSLPLERSTDESRA